MRISFFEESPNKTDFQKLQLLDFNPSLYVASPCYEEFKEIKRSLPNYEVIWWMTLPRFVGYWISPFTPKNHIIKLFKDIKKTEDKAMLDIEYPLLAPWLFLTQIIRFQDNKESLCQLISELGEKIILCENAGNNLCDTKCGKIWMCYTSLIVGTSNRKRKVLSWFCEEGVTRWGKNFKIGLGCIGKGILGIEPQLQVGELKRDLNIAFKSNVEEVIIYRLEGVLQEDKIVKKLNELAGILI